MTRRSWRSWSVPRLRRARARREVGSPGGQGERMPNVPLPPDRLRHRLRSRRPSRSETTADLEPLDGPFEQSRAAEALAFGASMRSEGYHVYALGPPGVGKHRLVAQVMAAEAARAPVPSDWCYVHDFAEPQRPRPLELPAGAGSPAPPRHGGRSVEELQAAVPAVFESEEYRNRLQALHKQMEQEREARAGRALEEGPRPRRRPGPVAARLRRRSHQGRRGASTPTPSTSFRRRSGSGSASSSRPSRRPWPTSSARSRSRTGSTARRSRR